jgi:methyl-accepting chemotaxis protein
MFTSLRLRFLAIGLLIASGLLAMVGVSAWIIGRVKVNGPIYQDIVLGKDLVGDILPPPEYIIEPYLLCLEMLDEHDPKLLREMAERSKILKEGAGGYDERHAYWSANLPAGPLRVAMVDESAAEALAFFALRDQRFLPAVLAGHADEARALLHGEMHQAYGRHRAVIDRVVTLAQELNAANEQHAKAVLAQGWLVLGVSAALLLLSLAACLAIIARNIVRPVHALVEAMQNLAAGDLTCRVPAASGDEIGRMGQAFNTTVANLHEVMTEIRGAADQTAASGEELSASAQNISSGAQTQSSTVEEISASIQELAKNITQVATSASEANRIAQHTSATASSGRQTMERSIDGMKAINESSHQIAKIIVVINQIANQTNLLALNAAIEAASAGEHGLGFAVVADEVRKLAERSSQAAQEIAQLIDESGKRVSEGASLSQEVGESLRAILDSITQTTQGIVGINAGTAQQATTAKEVSQSVESISAITEENSASAEEMAASAEELSAQAQRLQELVSRFHLDDEAAKPTVSRALKAPTAARRDARAIASAA